MPQAVEDYKSPKHKVIALLKKGRPASYTVCCRGSDLDACGFTFCSILLQWQNDWVWIVDHSTRTVGTIKCLAIVG